LTCLATIAALKALTAPSVATSIYVIGYFAAADGGEGWFDYNTASTASDNGGTVIIPNSSPGTGRWIRANVASNGSVFNVKWFGAKGDGATNDQTAVTNALGVALASPYGAIYFPSSSGCYLASITVPSGTNGFKAVGDTLGYLTNPGSCISSTSATATIDLQNTGESHGQD
jgi:hypothetical protein